MSIKKYLWQLPEDQKPDDKVVGVFSDTHFPFSIGGYLEFLIKTFDKFGVTHIVVNGDVVDNHALSRHGSHPNALGNITEKDLAQALMDEYVEVFPYVYYNLGNHDLIPDRQAATLGLSATYLKSFSELWNLPETWRVAERHIIDGVVYTHGTGAGGKDGAINLAIKNRMSTVIGHAHAYAGVKYNNNGVDTIFGMNSGSAVDNTTYAMAYGKDYPNKPVISCGIVFDSMNATVIVMDPADVKEVKVITPVVKEEVPFTVKRAVTPKLKKKQVFKGTRGNVQGTKHSGHMSKDDVLYCKFPNGDIMGFDRVIDCKAEVRKRSAKFKHSGLTAISRAARANGSAYGCSFTYDSDRADNWKGAANE